VREVLNAIHHKITSDYEQRLPILVEAIKKVSAELGRGCKLEGNVRGQREAILRCTYLLIRA